jgi:Na+-translocating ferredoxin:NAD+ oxidoreductase RnfG subunit
MRITLPLVVLAVFTAAVLQAETLATKEQAVKAIFPEATSTEIVAVTLTPEQLSAISAKYKWTVDAPELKIHVSKKDAAVVGRTLFISETGKHGAIWVAVGINPDGTVRDSVICAMQEVKGKPVANKMFLKQFIGKKVDSGFEVGKDIQAVSGATISTKAVVKAVRKALILVSVLK